MATPTPIPALAPELRPWFGLLYWGNGEDDVDCAEVGETWLLDVFLADAPAAPIDEVVGPGEGSDVSWLVGVAIAAEDATLSADDAGNRPSKMSLEVVPGRSTEAEASTTCLIENFPERANILRFDFVPSERTI